MRSAVIAAATALVLLAGIGVVAVLASYDGTVERTWARTPRDPELHPDEEVTVLVRNSFGDAQQIDHRPIFVTYLEPVDADSPLPPGVARWPEPGQVVVAPALMDELEVIEQRLGPVVGTIGREGLASLGERLVYARPEARTLAEIGGAGATGFGDVNFGAATGDRLYDQPASLLLILLALFVVTPSLVLLIVGIRMDRFARDHRAALLETLGATPRRVTVLGLRETRGPVLAGAAVAVAAGVASTLVDVPLPGVGFTVRHDDMGAARLGLLAATMIGLVVVLGVAVVTSRPGRPRRGTRVRSAAPRYRGVTALAAIVVIGSACTMAVRSAKSGDASMVLWVVGGAVVSAFLIPSLSGWLARWVAATVHTLAWRSGHPVGVVAGRQIGSALRQVARLASLNALLILFVVQAIVWMNSGTDTDSERLFGVLDGRVVVGYFPSAQRAVDDFPEALAALPDDSAPVIVAIDFETNRQWITATSDTLGTIGVTPGADSVRAADLIVSAALILGGGWFGDVYEVMVDPAPTPRHPTDETIHEYVVVIAPEGADLDVDQINGDLYRTVGPGWSVTIPGAGDRIGNWVWTNQSRWISWLGVIGTAILLAALWVAALDEIRRSAAAVAPLGALTARPTFFRAVAGVRVGTSVAVGCVVGAVGGYLFSQPLVALDIGLAPPYPTIAALCAVSVGIGAVVWAAASRAGVRAAQTWRPGKDET